MYTAFSLILLLLSFTVTAIAHPGQLDKYGGHYDHITLEYHCHFKKCLKQFERPLTTFKKKYKRAEWKHWLDIDHDCQNTRAELLITTSHIPVSFTNKKRCAVKNGEWVDLYTGKIIKNARLLDIDHIVPLKEAHDSGGAIWTALQKEIFANDPLNLIAVSAAENREKGSKDVAHWLPSNNPPYQCIYVKRFQAVKRKYQLSSDTLEQKAIESILARCAKRG